MTVILREGDLFVRDNTDEPVPCAACGHAGPADVVATTPFASAVQLGTKAIGVLLHCAACRAPVFQRYRVIERHPDHLVLDARGHDVERPPQRFDDRDLPAPVAARLREALACYDNDILQAFAVMCRLTAQAMFADVGNRGKLKIYDQAAEIRELAGIDDATFNIVRRVLFDSDLDKAGAPPALNHDVAAVLLETLKDLLYQVYIRRARLRRALSLRRHFASAEDREQGAKSA